jgi:hypothetical protein
MKCITIKQPYAWLVVNGVKDVENRTWVTNYRGPILIHAAKVVDVDGHAWLKHHGVIVPAIPKLVKGAIIGRAYLHRCTRYVTSQWHEKGQYGFYMRDPEQFETPIPYRGQLGIFEVTAEQLRAALEKAKAK